MIIHRKITIVNISRPVEKSVNAELQWLGDSLGLFSLRDKDKSCFRIFLELLKAAKHRQMLSSDEIAMKSNLTRGTVVHHLNKLMDAGIVVHIQGRYALRVEKLELLIQELERDLRNSLAELRHVATDIDHWMGNV